MNPRPDSAPSLPIHTLLVANRGEIALRIMRTARALGIKTVAVYSEADRDLPFVRYADQAVCIGPAASAESYLRVDKIMAAAHQTGANAIHPGYGFLSERIELARACREAGIYWVGPGERALDVMGNKITAKEAVKGFAVPLVPGSGGAITDTAEAARIAAEVGYPVLVKAAAGGGGKGMRLVHQADEFADQMAMAQSEALSAFGDAAVFVEKYILEPRHIEVQVLGDEHGNLVHLFERECSIQRRHQKVIEEAPSVAVDDALRARLGEAALEVARAVDYVGAGTVEFVMAPDGAFYFLEMNTRLQVEHPVTEAITGVDLVAEQLRIAAGLPLSFRQEDLSIRGHAVEARIYAEDPLQNFLPAPARLTVYRTPQGPGLRVDDGFEQGLEIPVHYDPMIAKLIAYGATREQALDRLDEALTQYRIGGPGHNVAFLRFVINHETFRGGRFDTSFIDRYFKPEHLEAIKPEGAVTLAAAALAAHLTARSTATASALAVPAHGNGHAPTPNSPVAEPVSAWRLHRG